MTNKDIDLANRNNNASGEIVKMGQNNHKEYLLDIVVPEVNAKKHRQCLCHIHDLEFYDITYNCIGVHVQDLVKVKDLSLAAAVRELNRGIIKLTNMQSGGIGFINFDEDMATYINSENDDEIRDIFYEFFLDLNMDTRKGCEKPYVTLNFGLDTSEKGRKVTRLVLEAFDKGQRNTSPFIFPNLVFKLSSDINIGKDSPNYDLYQKALSITARKMIPTYYNCDSTSNRDYKSTDIGVMGCRSRVVSNSVGREGSFNRGNIACVTLNLVQMAYRAKNDINNFLAELEENMKDARDLLMHHFGILTTQVDFTDYFKENYYLGSESKDASVMLSNGTLSIGFIGLWDAIQVLHNKIFSCRADFEEYFEEAYSVIKFMRDFTDESSKKIYGNFSLLASAAEGVTGRFAMYDNQHDGKDYAVSERGFYVNSFHIPVDIPISYMDKAKFEGPFHKLCNGGSITYVEFKEMPYKNVEAVQDVVEYAYSQDCNYIGINFPLDYCMDCGFNGRMLNKCPNCGNEHIKRLRRVSGYLAEEGSFAAGKRKEMKKRISHL